MIWSIEFLEEAEKDMKKLDQVIKNKPYQSYEDKVQRFGDTGCL